MVVISYSKIRAFITKHPQSTDIMNNWYRIAEKSDWANYHGMKNDFGSADAVGSDRYVFDIGGNRYRVITLIFFKIRTVYIRFVGSHAEYDKIKNASEV